MPAQRFQPAQRKVRGVLDEGGHQLVGLALAEKDEEDSSEVADVLVVEGLGLLLPEGVQEVLQGGPASVVEEGREDRVAEADLLVSEQRSRLVEVQLVFELIVDLRAAVEGLLEDGPHDDFVVLEWHPSKSGSSTF